MECDKAYREAEKKIEEARLRSETVLDLSEMGLTELPESLAGLTLLESLDLSGNNLAKLPDWLGLLTQLQSLNLSSNRLTDLAEWLGQLKLLESLDLSLNQLTTLPKVLKVLTQLQSLDLSFNKLTALPDCLGSRMQLESLDLSNNRFTSLPEWVGNLAWLQELGVDGNQLTGLPKAFGDLIKLESLSLSDNLFRSVPDCVFELRNLEWLYLTGNQIEELPDAIRNLRSLRGLILGGNEISKRVVGETIRQNRLEVLPFPLGELERLQTLVLDGNPLDPELTAAYAEGVDAVIRYLRAKAEAQVVLNEAKLILIGEGEVGKSCLLGGLCQDPWEEGRPTTHGIEIKSVTVTDPDSGTEITLNGWDFGGQRVYRPTHQLFFSAPAVYLVAWKPREGSQQGFVKEWISLVKHREPDAKILVVATHGGPGERQPDIDKQALWDLFGRETVLGFFHVDSKPDNETGERRGISDLKDAIARVAASLPEMGRTVPARWQQAREALKQPGAAYLPLEDVLDICHKLKIDGDEAKDFLRISHRLGHLIHYEHDPILQDIVVLKPDWLTTAISFVLDDKQTRDTHGLVGFARLSELWNNPAKESEFRYPPNLHPVFLRLMERFDLSYRVVGLRNEGEKDGTSLIAQLVPDARPDPVPGWVANAAEGDEQRVQICRVVETKNGQSAAAEGLFYQLIVRLHKYSLGRVNHRESVHWQRGLVVDDDYNGRALMEHVGNDVRITVRAPYPEAFLSVLTHEVKWLVESFWAGLRCDVMVPCVSPCGKDAPGTSLFEVQKLIESKRRRRSEYPCSVCYEWQSIDYLLRNAPAAQLNPAQELLQGFVRMKRELRGVRKLLLVQHGEALGRFENLDASTQRIISVVDAAFTGLMQALTDEAKDGPRLFSFQPVDPRFIDLPTWLSRRFRLTLWCEHSRLPLPLLNEGRIKRGVYELDLPFEWFLKVAPLLKVLIGTLSLVLPVASSAVKLALDDGIYRSIETELELAQKTIESVSKGMDKAKDLLAQKAYDVEHAEAIEAQGAVLRQLHALLKQKDPTFGGLVRVRNKRQEFLWVHPQFEKEY